MLLDTTIGLINANIIIWKGMNNVSDLDSEVLDPYLATDAIADQGSEPSDSDCHNCPVRPSLVMTMT
jgi:hypothetical protein